MIRINNPTKLLHTVFLGIFLSAPIDILAEQEHIFFDAPKPEELAGILFPPRYRGIFLNDDNKPKDPVFSMMINFEFDSTKITPSSHKLLQSVGEMMGMETVRQQAIVIEGHTDAIGHDAYNQRLSEKRARAIKEHLVQRYGIAPKRLLTVGKGERELYKRSNPSASINRRATLAGLGGCPRIGMRSRTRKLWPHINPDDLT